MNSPPLMSPTPSPGVGRCQPDAPTGPGGVRDGAVTGMHKIWVQNKPGSPGEEEDVASFDLFLPILLRFEGGFVDDPTDPGGETNKGITMATFRHLGKSEGAH